MNSSHRLNIGPLIIQAIPGIFFLVTIPAIDRKQPTRGRGGVLAAGERPPPQCIPPHGIFFKMTGQEKRVVMDKIIQIKVSEVFSADLTAEIQLAGAYALRWKFGCLPKRKEKPFTRV